MEIRIFGRIKDVASIPVMNSLQRVKYKEFLQDDVHPTERQDTGLEALFREAFPIESYDGTLKLEYVRYDLGRPRYSIEECRKLDLTYARPLKIITRLSLPEPLEESVYLGEMPMMVGGCEFVINGAERVVVAQLHRSPGVDFDVEVHPTGKRLHSCRIVPDRGSWIEMTASIKDILFVRIDRSGKFPVTCLLRALDDALSSSLDIIRKFYKTEKVKLDSGTVRNLNGRIVVSDVLDPESDEVIIHSGEEIPAGMIRRFRSAGIASVEVIKGSYDPLVLNTLKEDKTQSHENALLWIYSRLRPGNPANLEKARALLHERFYDSSRFRLGRVGRFRLNRKFNQNVDEAVMTLTPNDVINCLNYFLELRAGGGQVDDIDHLGNRRIRTINELLGDEVRKGLLKLRRTVQERMSLKGKTELSPRSLINYKTVSSAIDYFFARSELSQLVDQTNPLAQLTNERRLSALGPGGLHRKRAGFEVRDVHPSHYGRICPIETPEGTNIGLIVYLSLFAQVDEYGFLTTPYARIKDGKASSKNLVRLRADQEEEYHIAPADSLGKKRGQAGSDVLTRYARDYAHVPARNVDLVDVSSKQLVGVSASLIPFLEHDDANRALMGSNMQRQALPLLMTETPIVGTGMEGSVAQNSSVVVKAERAGKVTKVDACEIVISDRDRYPLEKFTRLNEGICLNQRPIVKKDEHVEAGQVIADGSSTKNGELGLGKNFLVAFLSWEGCNFEDAILLNERVVREDKFTSLHIEEFSADVRETQLGREEITRDIPNVSEKALSHLDEDGIVIVGTKVQASDILVGKVAPKSKKELSPEEKLLYAIFGRAGEDVKNESLVVPGGVEGVVIGTERYSRKTSLPPKERRGFDKEVAAIEEELHKEMAAELGAMARRMKNVRNGDLISKTTKKKISLPRQSTMADINRFEEALDIENLVIPSGIKDRIKKIHREGMGKVDNVRSEYDRKLRRIRWGTELPTGVLEKIKVYVATKRKIAVGDKISGRHGNKGVIAKIVPEADMPFLADGTAVDIVLNPLGVPSRMNVGQILETHLGWAAHKLGFKAVTPVFDGVPEEEIRDLLREAGLPEDGKTVLYDGRTGDPFDQTITVGYIYMMKLNHLVDEKVHARATGPYSLITQQPLGGKSRSGGQRFGEMEVWALEAYGAAHILQELLTVKSDDVEGRGMIYESMVKGENTLRPGSPASFHVLVNEIKGLSFNLKLNKKDVFRRKSL